jgi:hypothetical protein
MKKRTANPTDQKCPACDGIGFPKVVQPVQPDRRIYPAPCKMCGGKGRIKQAATETANKDGTRCLGLCWDWPQQIPRRKPMYKLAVAILLLSAPAFAQNNETKPNMPPTNMKNTVIPKSGGTQTPATTPTTAAQANQPATTATRPAKAGPEQTSVPNAAPPATTTQTTGATNQDPKIKGMNEDEKKKIEKEGK